MYCYTISSMTNFFKTNYFFLKLFIFFIIIFLTFPKFNDAFSQTNTRVIVNGSGLKVPRFVSIKDDEANLRKGPSTNHEVDWVYKISGLPLKIIAEFDHWRKVIDSSGSVGWIHKMLLSSKRTAEITRSATSLYEKPSMKSKIVANAEVGAILSLVRCKEKWCRLKYQNLSGWVTKNKFFGSMEDEKFE